MNPFHTQPSLSKLGFYEAEASIRRESVSEGYDAERYASRRPLKLVEAEGGV